MKETELNAHVRKWNADSLEEKKHEKLSLLPLLICFSGPCGVYPCPNDSRFDLNTSWIDGLARMKYSSWIWEFLATWMTWKGKKEMTRTWKGKYMKENEKIWKDVRENELKWKERQWQQTRLTPPKIRKLYLVLLYWFLITFGLLWGSPLAQVNWCWLCFCLVLFK